MATNAAKRAVRHRIPPTDMVEGSAPVCPKCGAPVDVRIAPHGYGVTIEQCSRGFPACDHWRPLSTRVRPELARRPRGVETPRVRRSPGLLPPRAGTRRPRANAGPVRILAALSTDPAQARSATELASLCGLTPGSTQHLCRALRAAGRVRSRAVQLPGQTGRPGHVYWRVA